MRQHSPAPRSWWPRPDAATLYAADGTTVIAHVARTGCGFAGQIHDATPRYAGSRRIWLTDVVPALDDAMQATEEMLWALEHSRPSSHSREK